MALQEQIFTSQTINGDSNEFTFNRSEIGKLFFKLRLSNAHQNTNINAYVNHLAGQ